jgi:hypothetical protein
MKFLALSCLAVSATASVMIQRGPQDLATIKGVLAEVSTDIVALDTATKGFSGDPSPLLDASNELIKELKDGKAKVEPVGGLTLTEALGLQAPTKDMQGKAESLVASLKAKKDALAAAGLCSVTRIQVNEINVASRDLIKTVVSKVPESARGIADTLVAPLLKALDESKEIVSEENCKDSGGEPTTTPGSPTTTPGTPTTSSGPTQTPPGTTMPTVTTGPTATGTCPAASTVTITTTDSSGCTATPSCTKTPPVTVTTTTKACPKGSKLPW